MLDRKGKRISCSIVLNVPRLMFTANFNSILNSVAQCGFRVITAEGVYYDQTMEGAIEQVMDSDYLMFVDYDSIFTVKNHVKPLFDAMFDNPEIDAIVPIQISRHSNLPLCFDPLSDYKSSITKFPIGHFGLTIMKSSVFKRLKRPWFCPKPNDKGEWKDGKIDADISFWNNCKESGINVWRHNGVCIGHMDLMVKWPAGGDQIIVQPIREFQMLGMPKEAYYQIQPEPSKTDFKINLDDE